ncbi:hypothetical protein [Erythrobacter rubeus]|uniref:RcnB family protein n=1 Tax=Erythrobacter rubeus TaxID=2760803 RepID=A0ABR8KP85_9SPHN|nr:hypothetical protein [Erythrobacter rubeus]MBD2842528.1 hypothetical protein [Erythrobacter rubeus]
MMRWLASAAAIALIASPAALAQGQGNGKGKGNGGPPSAAERGNPGNGGGNGRGRGNAGNRGGPPIQAQGGGGNGNRNAGNRGGPPRQVNRGGGNRGGGPGIVRGNGNGIGSAVVRGNGNRGNQGRGGGNGIDIDIGFAPALPRDTFGTRTRLIGGCPPGLAKKRNGCLPPGQARQRFRRYDPGFFGLFGGDGGRFFYNDGYLLRYRADGLAGFVPLLAGALGIGNIWPSTYEARRLPRYYEDYYGFDDPRGYRYADNVIYRVNPETAAITSVAALLTGDDIVVGQPMPRGYDVYNVPYAYRDRYYDRPGARYRYADGYIYEIDPETALVAAAIDLAI